MFITSFRSFLRDESGSYTVWSLIWFSLYVAMGGLAVDMTDAYRNQTLLQATADASALSGVLSLPDASSAKDEAVAYSADNMGYGVNGIVLERDEVFVGNWDFTSQAFTDGGTPLNAVRVITRRDDGNGNPLAANFLHILSLWGIPFDRFNISTEAIAIKYVPECLNGGMVSYNALNVTSGNGFHSKMCLHAQNAIFDNREQDFSVSMNNGNTLDPGVTVSMPRLEELDGRPNILSNNTGLAEALIEGDLWPKDAMAIQQIMDKILAFDLEYMPSYVLSADGLRIANAIEHVTPGTFPTTLIENTVYEVTCGSSGGSFSLPKDVVLRNVAIITDCSIHAANAAVIENVLIASSDLGNGSNPTDKHTINLASDAYIGSQNFCTIGTGGVEIYALASVHIAAKLDIRGLRAVVGGDFSMTAQGNVEGISLEAMDRIEATANGDFGLCPNGTPPPGRVAWQYRLIR
jgi:hypothetical protein